MLFKVAIIQNRWGLYFGFQCAGRIFKCE